MVFAGYSPLAPPSQSPPNLSSLLHNKQVITQVAATSSSPSTGPAAVAVSGQNKKYRPPHKTDKFTPKPIPPELGNLKTYSEYSSPNYEPSSSDCAPV